MTATNNKLVPHKRFPEFENSGDWEEKKLEDIGNFFRGHSYSKEDVSTEDNGNTIVLRSNNIDEYHINYNDLQYVTKKCRKEIIVQNNDIIICMSNGSANLVGKNAYIRYDKIPYDKKIGDKDITVGAFCGIYRTENQVVKYFFQSDFYKKQLQTLFAGSNINNLKGTDILSMYIYTPTSSKEQQKIADFLSSFDELIDLEQQKLEKLKEYKKGLLQNLFPKENQKVPDLRFPEFKNSGEWVEKKLGDIGEIITGKTPSTSNRELWKDEIAFVTPSDIKGNKYQYITERMVTNMNIKLLPVGTIMFSCIATIGKIAIAKVVCTTNQQINSIIIDVEKINNEFVYYSLQSIISKIKAKYEKDAFSIINKTEFSNILVKVSPLNTEQQKIADFLSSVDELIIEQTTKLQLLYDYKKGLLQQLFAN